MGQVRHSRDEVIEPDHLMARLSYRIRLLQIAAYKSFEKKVQGFGTAPRYYGLLKIVQANPGIAQTRLAEAIFLDRSSLVPILVALTREGWVRREPASDDQRVRRVFLTKAGEERIALLERDVIAHEAAMMRGFSEAERDQLLGLLGRIDANLRQALAGPEPGEKP